VPSILAFIHVTSDATLHVNITSLTVEAEDSLLIKTSQTKKGSIVEKT